MPVNVNYDQEEEEFLSDLLGKPMEAKEGDTQIGLIEELRAEYDEDDDDEEDSKLSFESITIRKEIIKILGESLATKFMKGRFKL